MKLIDVTPENSVVPVFVEQLTELEQTKREEDLAQTLAEAAARQAAQEAKAAARQSALAKLAELGLTEEEIAAL